MTSALCVSTLPAPTTKANPLLLVVHGRAGGMVPAAVLELAAELQRRRRAPVLVQALTGAPPELPELPSAGGDVGPVRPVTVVPLMLVPGSHVRHDIPAIASYWRQRGPVRRRAFLGAWPAWQRALVEELAADRPVLVHHPLEGPLARRFLAHLERCTGARCVAASYSDPSGDGLLSSLFPAPGQPDSAPSPAVLPLALAANRLTDALGALVGPPLLERPRFRQVLLAELEALP